MNERFSLDIATLTMSGVIDCSSLLLCGVGMKTYKCCVDCRSEYTSRHETHGSPSFSCGQPLGPGVAHHGMRNLIHHAYAHVASPRGERLAKKKSPTTSLRVIIWLGGLGLRVRVKFSLGVRVSGMIMVRVDVGVRVRVSRVSLIRVVASLGS